MNRLSKIAFRGKWPGSYRMLIALTAEECVNIAELFADEADRIELDTRADEIRQLEGLEQWFAEPLPPLPRRIEQVPKPA